MTSPGDGNPAQSHAVTAGVLRGRLFLTSYAPLFAILAARTAPGIGDPGEPLWPFITSAAVMCIGFGDGWFLLRGATHRGAIEVTPIRVEEQGAAAAGYLPTYLLPFIGPSPGTVGGWIGYGIYLAVLFVVFLSSDFALVNPTLYILGRRVVRVARIVRPVDPSAEAQEESILVIARKVPAPRQTDQPDPPVWVLGREGALMVDINWTGIDLSGDPRLIVGRRPRPKHLEAERVDVHQDAHPALREIAETAVQELADTQPRVYEPFAELEIGEEHFELPVGVGVAGAEDGAELPQLMSVVDELSSVDARDLKDQSNLFYALCWTSDAGVTGFVRQTDPVRVLRHGRRFFQYEDALRSVEAPDFALDGLVDFVFHAGTVGILRPTPFRNLFADVDVALSGVPTYIANARAALASTAPITDSSAAALQAVVSRRVTFASRLRRLADRLAEVPITADAMLAAAARHLDDPSLVIDASGQLEFDEDHVGVVLDLLEGRLFEDDFSGQHRRADRFSSR